MRSTRNRSVTSVTGDGVAAVVVDDPHQGVQPLVRDGPRGEATAVGAALLDGAQVRSGRAWARGGGERDARQQARIRRIRQAGDHGEQPGRQGRDPEVVQRRPAADDEVAPRGVGGCQPARLVGVQLDAVGTDPPRPRLGVVHARCSNGERHEPTGRLDREADGRVHARAHRTLRAVWKGPLPGRDVCTSMGMPLVVVRGVLLMSSSVEAAVARP